MLYPHPEPSMEKDFVLALAILSMVCPAGLTPLGSERPLCP